MTLTHYENQPFAFPLPGDDEITFFVLTQILNDSRSQIYTDGKDVMICHSHRPMPVWVWCRDEDDKAALEAICACLKAHFPPADGYRYNLSHSMLERLRRADAAFAGLKVTVNMLSYRLDALLPASHPCDGHMQIATMDELDALAPLFQAATFEMEHMERPLEECRAIIAEKIEAGTQFLWYDADGALAAMTSYRAMGRYGKIAGVYTLPDRRRRGYAMNLVRGVTARLLELGLTPILYTDEDYAASNACYQKIGYRQVGSLCTAKM